MRYNSRPIGLLAGHISPITLLAVLLCLLLVVPLSPAGAQSSTTIAVVKRAAANLREGPGLQYEVLGTVKRGFILPVLGQHTNENGEVWYKVSVQAFGEVWVASWVVRVNVVNADIPAATFASEQPIVVTAVPASPVTQSGGNVSSGDSGNTGGAVPPPMTTPEP